MPWSLAQSREADADAAVQGEYAAPGLGLQVVAVGKDEFEFALYAGGLPGAGWDRTPPQRADGNAKAIASLVTNRKLQRVERRSPTLAAKPPSGALVLFDGSEASLANWESGAKRTADGLLMPGATTRGKFRDYSLHVEFQTPFQPDATGQARGNSGVYHQGRYETQILDSFGLEGEDNEAGAIYEVRSPDVNMCFPPLSWQTYDIDFTSARFDAQGQKTADAQMTVRLNGVVVHRDVRVSKPTRAAPLPENDSPGPIHLQDHGNPVRFRNVWLVPRDADREALHPIVPGFERFFASFNASSFDQGAKEVQHAKEVLGGRLLIAQLGCAACHQTNDSELQPKSAPLLRQVGNRVRLDHLVSFVGQPHQTKRGTTMPDVLHHLTADERARRVSELASWLSTTGKTLDRPGDTAAAQRGADLFHTIGCVACHAPRRGEAVAESTSVPLGDLTAKYTLDSLAQFLLNPHAVRKSGNMPKLVGSLTEARDVACYLLGEAIIAPGAEQFNVSVYHGSWQKLPGFDKLKPVKQGSTNGLDLTLAGRENDFAMRFDAFLPIQQAGQYSFYLGSDDGSRLLVDNEEVIKVDGIHPFEFRRGRKKLDVGIYPIRIEYFENAGEQQLQLEIEGPGLGRSPIALWAMSTKDQGGGLQPLIADKFRPANSLIDAGMQTFRQVGCANCHVLEQDGKPISSTLVAPAFDALHAEAGCLAEQVPAGAPDYALNRQQRQAIAAALAALKQPLSDEQQVHLTLASKNCYACHSRGAIGGPEQSRDAMFKTRTPEMGNEGRLPPPLTGVGDKLKPQVIDAIIAEGAKDRPYMLTRMPAFGKDAMVGLREQLVSLDAHAPARGERPQHTDAEHKQLVVEGRKLVGSGGLACIKCHTFGNKSTAGIQAIDMLTMTARLREDWFHRYMLAPAEYRPGTRMPLSFPEGKSVLPDVLGGDADAQIDAMLEYLSEGSKARPPAGLGNEAIVLVPDQRPIIYRNFLEGLSPRGIAVGYPQRVNLAWDAGQMNLALLWKNDFIDAGKHWVGRGPGAQGPLGDFVVSLPKGVTVARLDAADSAWPEQSARELDYRFRGYRLDAGGQPAFRYAFEGVQVEDYLLPVGIQEAKAQSGEDHQPGQSGFERRLSVSITKPTPGLFYRVATGKISQRGENIFYDAASQLTIRVEGGRGEIIQRDGVDELRVNLPESGEKTIKTWLWW